MVRRGHGNGVAFILLLGAASCSSGESSGNGDGPVQADYTVLVDGPGADGADLSGDAVTKADGSLPAVKGDLRAIVAAMPFVPEGGGYSPPSKAEVQSFEAGITTLLLGQHEAAASLFKKVGLEAVALSETGGQQLLLVREPAASVPRGWGLYAFDVSPSRPDLIIEVPHTRFEEMTEDEGAEILIELGAAALMVAGTHRCASTTVSPCDGKTKVCSSSSSWESYTVSDVAHFTDGPFHAAHRAVTAHRPKAVAIQLHGFAHDPGEPHAIVSDGTTFAAPSTSLSNRLAAALEQELGQSVESCNQKHTATLCGTTNVQGRHSNGSPAPCTVAASAASGRFLHLEQSKEIRGPKRKKVLAALKSVLP